MSAKIINIEKFLHIERNSVFYWPKKILARAIARYIREPELNELLVANKDKQGAEWARGILDTLNISIETNGEDHLQSCGRYVLVGNHPLGGVDGLAVIAIAGKYHASIRSLSHSALQIIPNTHSIIVPIETKTINSRDVVAAIDALFQSEHQVLIFPAGVVSQKTNGKIMDLPWAKTFLTKAIAYKRDIIPVYINASNSQGFYRFSRARRFLGHVTGLRFEIFSLAKEGVRPYSTTIGLTFGRPISWQTFNDSRSFYAWAQSIRSYVYYLKSNPQVSFLEYLGNKEANQ